MTNWAAIAIAVTLILAIIAVFYRAGKLEGKFEAGLTRFEEGISRFDKSAPDLARIGEYDRRIQTVENTLTAISGKSTEILVRSERHDVRLGNIEERLKKFSGQMPAVRVAIPRPGAYSANGDDDEKEKKR